MITVKAFRKDEGGLYTSPTSKNKFYLEIGKTYTHEGKVKLCRSGFHASRNCDISETVAYYPVNSYYCLVDIDVIDGDNNKMVGNRITLLKELTFEECVSYDKSGEWCYQFAENIKRANVKLLQNAVIEKDITGNLCYRFAKNIERINVKLLQNAVIKKDTTGEWCYYFAKYVKGANVELLQNAVIEKDNILLS